MSTRNLDALFEPATIALVGASNRPGSVGAVLARNLFEGGFQGPIMTVNPHERAIRSTLNYHSVADLPLAPDLAVISTPPQAVPGIITELGARGCRAAVVITAGFGEGDRADGQELMQTMLDAARPHLLRIVGPNCLGFMSPHVGINASFAHLTPQQGDIAFLTQSGAMATSVLDWASARGIGFSHIVSLGSMSDVDFGDLLDYLALDGRTRAILLYVESVTHARKFMSAARMASRTKPVVVVKAGRSAAGAKAALSHTGALAGSDAVYDAAFRRAGMLRVQTSSELFQAVGTLDSGIRVKGDRLTILTNGGGLGVLAVDQLAEVDGTLAVLSAETIARLDKILPAPWSHGNPVDILGDASGERYAGALEILLDADEADATFVLNCPTAVADSLDAAQAVVKTLADRRPTVLTCWLGAGAAADARRLFAERKIPSFESPEQAVQAFGHLLRYRRNQLLLVQTPPSVSDLISIDHARAEAIIDAVLADDRTLLTEPEAKQLLSAFGIPTVESMVARDPAEAALFSRRIDGPVVLKIVSRDISHKSDVGGVVLNLASPAAVAQAATDMLETIQRKVPGARIDGFNVQPMIRRPGAHELILGIAEDATFGPVILFGQGGTAVEVIGDRAVALPPLNPVLAHDMIERTRISRLLRGYRDRPAADLDAIALTIVKLSHLLVDLDRVAELDINPLLADADGVIALDARVVVRPRGTARRPLAIRPYPRELEQAVETQSGRHFLLRPIRPEDELALTEMLEQSSEDDVRLRFFAPRKHFGHGFSARLTQIDYDREMALVALEAGGTNVLGVVRLLSDPDGEAAEFAIMVRSDMQDVGLGYCLMRSILDYARQRGIGRVFSEVLSENRAMLQMAGQLGFVVHQLDDRTSVKVEIDLTAPVASDKPG
ncbi:MAG: bifunctional acetate--CoA ligase family protein/GNAT family N-acetyltransferase [Rhodanobacter sp.]